MSEKKSFNEKLNNFFAGKGFYIVLSLCVAVIGVSAWFLFTGRGTDVDPELANTPVVNVIQGEANAPTETIIPAPPQVSEAPEEPELQEEPQDETPVWNEQQAEAAANSPFIWPLEGTVELPYSVTALVYNERLGDWRTNDCVEISAPLGAQVMAVSAGTVESVSFDDMGGMSVVIQHAGGLRSIYSNLAAVPTVYEGDNVMTGEVIGSVGTTAPGETAESPCLRLKMTLDGVSVDPADYLPPR